MVAFRDDDAQGSVLTTRWAARLLLLGYVLTIIAALVRWT